MKFIKNFYYGNIAPSDQYFNKGTKYEKLLKSVEEIRSDLGKRLSEQDMIQFDNFSDCQGKMSTITEEENYISGFRDGARMMIDVLHRENEILGSGDKEVN